MGGVFKGVSQFRKDVLSLCEFAGQLDTANGNKFRNQDKYEKAYTMCCAYTMCFKYKYTVCFVWCLNRFIVFFSNTWRSRPQHV